MDVPVSQQCTWKKRITIWDSRIRNWKRIMPSTFINNIVNQVISITGNICLNGSIIHLYYWPEQMTKQKCCTFASAWAMRAPTPPYGSGDPPPSDCKTWENLQNVDIFYTLATQYVRRTVNCLMHIRNRNAHRNTYWTLQVL